MVYEPCWYGEHKRRDKEKSEEKRVKQTYKKKEKLNK
jgi:Tfp pilus assembly protein PilO